MYSIDSSEANNNTTWLRFFNIYALTVDLSWSVLKCSCGSFLYQLGYGEGAGIINYYLNVQEGSKGNLHLLHKMKVWAYFYLKKELI